jgi:tetratricopeptide (TPR) repeat protein
MNRSFCLSLLVASALLGSGCGNVEFTHVKPGESARLAVLTRNAPVAKPLPGTGPVQPGMSAANGAAIQPLPNIPPDPALPDPHNTADKVAELYTKGSFAMQAGQIGEAIIAMEEAVQLDPNFSDAWSKLVILYQRAGKDDKATEAYKKAKKLGQPNGPSTLSPRGTSALIP